MSRRPTAQQIDLLAAVERGEVSWVPGRQGAISGHRDRVDGAVTPALTRLMDRGWVTSPGGAYRPVTAALTSAGKSTLDTWSKP